MISDFMQEEEGYYKFYITDYNSQNWIIMQNEADGLFDILKSDKRITRALIAVMKYYTQCLFTEPQHARAIRFHIDNYYKTMHDLQYWIRIGIDWRLCQTGIYHNIPLVPNKNIPFLLDMAALGKLGCLRRECLKVNLDDLSEIYDYKLPDYPEYSFSNLLLRERNPFGELETGRTLYTARIEQRNEATHEVTAQIIEKELGPSEMHGLL
jgi:hypothetical protein